MTAHSSVSFLKFRRPARLRPALPIMLIVVAMLALLAGGCATTKDVEQLQRQNQQDRQEAREMFQLLQESVQKENAPVREKQADLWAEIEAMRADIAQLQGQVADMNLRLTALYGDGNATASLPDVAADVEAIKTALVQQLALDIMPIRPKLAQPVPGVMTTAPSAVQPGAESAPATTATAPAVTSTDPAQALYDRAYAAFGEKQYDQARQLFAEFTTTFKKHALVPNAIFWQGQAYFELGDYQRAILAYQDVIKNYAQSPKFKHSMLKQGIAFYRLGKKDLGKIVLDDLIKKYPDSTEATRAKQFMSEN